MHEIPPAKDTDAEDVVWGLQTAASLWRRGERNDAVGWLRRAVQAASDAGNDDRALELARVAAELADLLGPSGGSPVPSFAGDPDEQEESTALDAIPHAAPPPVLEEAPASSHSPSVPPADKVHAGMYDPWAEQAAPAPAPPMPLTVPPRAVAVPSPSITESAPQPSPRFQAEEEIVTSVKGQTVPIPSRPAHPKPPAVPSRKPPPLPPRALSKKPPAPVVEVAAVDAEDEASAADTTPPPPLVPDAPPAAAPAAPAAPAPAPAAAPAAAGTPALDLEGVEAFADLPDDARAAFAAAAKVHVLAETDEVAGFALAYVVEGALDVAATMVDAPAVRLAEGAVLRARGTTAEGVPMRIIAASPRAVVACWSDGAVDAAFSNCPWVEDDLRAASDRVMTLVGITIGPLGERLDQSIREEIIGRLTVRPLLPGEIVVNKGETVPGLLLVGVGELELVDGDSVKGVVGSGDFLFATEVLGAGPAPQTARAGAGGALVMFGDRHVAQELMVTCPPLLEVFAGM